MSEVELKQELDTTKAQLDTVKAQLDQSNNMLKVANAKHSAVNHSLGVALGESNDVKAANILYQEREKELMSKVQELTFKIQGLEGELLEAHRKVEALQKQLDELAPKPVDPQEQPLAQESHVDHMEL